MFARCHEPLRTSRLAFASAWFALAACALAGEVPPATALPAEVDLQPQFDRCGLAVKNQGGRPTCSLFAVTGLAEFEWGTAQPAAATRFSEEFLAWGANDATGTAGDQAMFHEATQALQRYGMCREDDMPYDAGSSSLPSEAARRDARSRDSWRVIWIKRWNIANGLSSEQSAAIREQLSAGHPVAVGMRWPTHPQLDEHAQLTTAPGTGVVDGHSVLLVGYRDDASQPGGGSFKLRNSFGPEWGAAGYAWLSYDYVQQYTNDALALRVAESATPQVIDLKVAQLTAVVGGYAAPQDMTPWHDASWTGGDQVLCRAIAPVDFVFEFDVPEAGEYRVELLATCAPDYGTIDVAVDGDLLAAGIDLQSGLVSPTGPIELGVRSLGAGRHRLILRDAGSSGWGTPRLFGVDAILLYPTAK